MNIMLTGHSRHGKDEAAKILAETLGCTYKSSSLVACETFLFDRLVELGYEYQTPEDAWCDRNSSDDMKALWYREISDYNLSQRGTGLMRAIYAQSPIYVGVRDRLELIAGIQQGVINLTIWIDRSEHVPPQPESSMTVLKSDADIIVDNNSDLAVLARRVYRLGKALKPIPPRPDEFDAVCQSCGDPITLDQVACTNCGLPI